MKDHGVRSQSTTTAKGQRKPIRIVLVGGQPVVTAGLHLLLDANPGFTVVDEWLVSGAAELRSDDTRASLRAMTDASKTDLILVSVDGGIGASLGTLLASVPDGMPMMVLGSAFDQWLLADAFRHGVTGAVLMQETPDVLFEALRQVQQGQVWLDASCSAQLVVGLSDSAQSNSPESTRVASLTKREREVVTLVGEGLRNLEIANRLFISEVTVRNHLTSIYKKLDLPGRFQLALYAFKYGLSELPRKVRMSSPAKSKGKKSGARTA